MYGAYAYYVSGIGSIIKKGSFRKTIKEMKGKINNQGFSLVELIIVIAIIAILVGVLAPQYLKFANNARVSTDITNANELAKVIDAAISESYGATVPTSINGPGGTIVSNVPGLTVLPVCKVNTTYEWIITSSQANGVDEITLNGLVIYSSTGGTNEYYDQYFQD